MFSADKTRVELFAADLKHISLFFQVDAMLPNARYPIVIAPLPLGVDRRETNPNYYNSRDLTLPLAVEKKDCFWMQNEEKPFPVIELVCSYIPEQNMTWIPSLNIFICPMKVQIDVDYILRVLGMIISSVYKVSVLDACGYLHANFVTSTFSKHSKLATALIASKVSFR